MNRIFSGMNYLAHAHLSFGVPHVLVGNMISDFVKGAQKSGYAASVQRGIELHRAIDHFTDNHPATAAAKQIFRPVYRLYSGPIVDVLYDHFLATDDAEFTQESLQAFTRRVYQTLEEETVHLPLQFLPVFTYMRMQNWLYHYRQPEGIEKSLRGLARRATYMSDSAQAYALFLSNYNELRQCYLSFFPDVKRMAKDMLASAAG